MKKLVLILILCIGIGSIYAQQPKTAKAAEKVVVDTTITSKAAADSAVATVDSAAIQKVAENPYKAILTKKST